MRNKKVLELIGYQFENSGTNILKKSTEIKPVIE